jgi:hypothetical protein
MDRNQLIHSRIRDKNVFAGRVAGWRCNEPSCGCGIASMDYTLHNYEQFAEFIDTIPKAISYCDRRQLVNVHHLPSSYRDIIFVCCAQYSSSRRPGIYWIVEASCGRCLEMDRAEKEGYVLMGLILDELLGRDIRRLIIMALITREFAVPEIEPTLAGPYFRSSFLGQI